MTHRSNGSDPNNPAKGKKNAASNIRINTSRQTRAYSKSRARYNFKAALAVGASGFGAIGIVFIGAGIVPFMAFPIAVALLIAAVIV